MSDTEQNDLNTKREKFSSFFLIEHPITINILPISSDIPMIDMQDFEKSMPYAFRIGAEMSEIESQALRPFRNMGEKFEELIDYLQLQARKMDLMMSYILQQQDDPEHRTNAQKFGGGGLSVFSEKEVNLGDCVEVKLFLEDEAAAVFTYAEAINCDKIDDNYLVDYYFTHIREQDQELLVRASLHLQTKQLRKQKNS
ncbi:MAG: PilZ domain-containing protein [Pseudomonadota bacterium]